MRIGFGAPVSGAWATPHILARFAAEAEARGYGSLWTFQRLLVPEGASMEPVYHSVLDPMVTLGYAAALTTRIRLGWMPEEFTATGGTMAGRGGRTAEYIDALRHLWAGGGPAFSGEFYQVPAGKVAPRPVQRPGPPILLG